MINKIVNKKVLAAAMVVALTAGFSLSGNLEPVSIKSAHAQSATIAGLPDFTKLVEQNGKTVVSIEVTKTTKTRSSGHPFGGMPKDQLDQLRKFGFPMPFGQMPRDFEKKMPKRKGQGSGFIISSDGLILTNHHVVSDADEVVVHLTDKREFKAKVLGSDENTDVAVIKIDAKDLPVAKLGDSSKVKVGEWVAAIGAPFGLENTVTQGIVSAMSRNLPDDQFVPFIQSDAAVNPGNSGGPLFNMAGEVIGINSQIFSTSGGYMGMSFSIPINLAVQIKDQLIKDGKVSRGRIGVMIQGMTPELAKSFGLDKPNGALIAQVEKDGPAAKAGLEEGDIVIEYAGKPVVEVRDLTRAVADTKPGTSSKIKVLRDGKEIVLQISPEELKSSGSTAKTEIKEKTKLGVTVRPLNDEEKKKTSNGLVITEVFPDSTAEESGLMAGDIIIRVGGKNLKNFDELKKAVADAKESLPILIERKGQRTFMVLKFKQESKDQKK